MLETKKFSPAKQRAFDARFEAQKIAFGPVVFHCVHYAWKRGVLEALGDAGERGVTLDELEATGQWSRYALKLVLESCLSAGVVMIEGGRWQLDKTGFCLISDDITRVNFDFIHDVCYQGLFELARSLDAGKPLGPWPTWATGPASIPCCRSCQSRRSRAGSPSTTTTRTPPSPTSCPTCSPPRRAG